MVVKKIFLSVNILFIALLFPQLNYAQASDQIGSWLQLGPEGGRINTLIMHPTNPKILYAQPFTYPTRIFKSFDRGANWLFISQIDDYIYAMTINPKNPSVLYGVSDVSFYKSNDHGLTWQKYQFVPVSYYAIDVHVCPSNSNLIYIGGSYNKDNKEMMAVCKSTDGGLNWEIHDVLLQDYEKCYTACFAVNPFLPDELYIGGEVYTSTSSARFSGALFKSVDGGITWTSIKEGIVGNVHAIAVDPIAPNKIYVASSESVYRKSRSESTWQKSSHTFFSYNLAIDPKNNNIIYAGSRSIVYKSIDGGRSWKVHNNGLNGICRKLLIDYYDTNNIFYSSTVGIYRSSNYGLDWTVINSGISAAFITAMALAPSNPHTLFVELKDIAIFKTVNGGKSWTQLPEFINCGNIEALAVSPSLANVAYALRGFG